MNNFKASLDNYLTTEPQNNFIDFVEDVSNYYPEEILNDVKFIDSETETTWLEKLYFRLEYSDLDENGHPAKFGDITPKKAAAIITRAYNLFYL